MVRVYEAENWDVYQLYSWGCPTFSKSNYPDFANTCMWCAVCQYDADVLAHDYTCGAVDDDIFGENISYGRNNVHHWNSIVHNQLKGTIYNCSSTAVQTPLDPQYHNLWTGGKEKTVHMHSLRENTSVLFLSPFMEYGHTGTYTQYVLEYVYRYYPALDAGTDVYAISFNQYEIWRLKDGTLSLSQTTKVPASKVGQVVTLYNFQVNEGYIRQRRYVKSTANYIRTTSPSATTRNVIEALDILAHTSTPNRKRWSTIASTKVAGRHVGDIPMPNFDVLFPSEERNPNWRSLAAEAYQSLGMSDINGIAYLGDLIAAGSEVRAFARTLRAIPSSKVKAAASAWLAVHYGFKLMLADTKTLYQTLVSQSERRQSLSRCQSSCSWSHGTRHYEARYQVFYDQFQKVESLIYQLALLSDSVLTSENVWDMVPFSFVIDWFVAIGDVLQSLDNYASLVQDHTVICAGKSTKGSMWLRPAQLNISNVLSCNVQAISYRRRYSKHLQQPSLLPNTNNPFNHLVEGAALLISRR